VSRCQCRDVGILDRVVQIIVLNGGSSSGKTEIARCLQSILPEPWIRLSVDDLVEALPPSLFDSDSGISFGQQGEVAVSGGFLEVEAAWMVGVAAMARAGARVIFDDVFLSGAASQERIRAYLKGLDVLWAGVHCDPVIAAGREIARGDRVTGMAALQADVVHKGVAYDIEVDTSRTQSLDCARLIAARVSLDAACRRDYGRGTVDTLMS
jgi:chloramphenicol 3-O phosphotransferase